MILTKCCTKNWEKNSMLNIRINF